MVAVSLTLTERKFLIRALNRALTTKVSAIRDVREILDDKNLTFDDLIIGKQEQEVETKIETTLPNLNFTLPQIDKEELGLKYNLDQVVKPHIKPIPTNKIINDLEYANLHFNLLTPRQQEFIEEKFTSRDNNWIANGKDFTQKQNEYLGVIVARIIGKVQKAQI